MRRDRNWVARRAMDDAWLAQVHEDILDPAREIVDPHHHFWNRGGSRYEVADLWQDTGSGHNVRQTVFIECATRYHKNGPEALRPVGETTYVAGLARAAADHPENAQIAAIIAHADLRNPQLDAVLDAHIAAANGLLRGIRQSGALDPAPEDLAIAGRGIAGLYRDPAFQAGVRRLGARGLTYETWHYHHQNDDFLALVRAAPDTTIILNHFGTPLGVGRFKGRRGEIFNQWRKDMAEIAACPNVIAKLGGFAMPDNGWGWHERALPPTSDEFVAAQGPWYDHMIACFTPDRAMFESNFPVDRVSISYPVLWNAFKKIARPLDEAAKTALFSATARRVYRL